MRISNCWKTFFGKKRIVAGIDNECGDSYLIDKVDSAALMVVVHCIAKSVKRCSVSIVKINQGFDAMKVVNAEFRKCLGLRLDFVLQANEETHGIDVVG